MMNFTKEQNDFLEKITKKLYNNIDIINEKIEYPIDRSYAEEELFYNLHNEIAGEFDIDFNDAKNMFGQYLQSIE